MALAPILTVIKEGETLKTCPIEGEVMLGRSEDCAISLDDRAISRQHALFRLVGNNIQVEKKSEFGTLTVNGAACSLAVLKEGDIITIGPYLIKLSMPSSIPSAPVAAPAAAASLAPSSSPSFESQEPNLASSDALEMAPQEDAQLAVSLESPNSDVLAEPILGSAEDPAANSEEVSPALEGGSESPAVQFDLGSQIDIESPSNGGVEPIAELQVPETSELIGDDAKTKITPSGKVTVKLIFPEGKANHTEYELTKDEVSIGRGKDCDIVLDDKKASRKNAIIRRAGINFSIKDLDSANGTYVNGVKIQEKELSGDDLIKIGGVEFQFKALSVDYASREKGFLSLPPEAASPELDLGSGMSPEVIPQGQIESPITFDGQVSGSAPPSTGMSDVVSGTGDAAGIPGITGISPSSGKKGTLLEKFRALPKRTQAIGGVAALLFLLWLNEDDVPEGGVKKQVNGPKKAVTAPTGEKGPLTFESLSAEQKRFVEAQHNLAFDYYKNHEYDKSLFEVEKIFALIPDYKDSREIQRYARAGKQKLEAIEEERRKKEEEAALKKKIALLVDETKERMDKKNYEQAKELFAQILALDPDNIQVANWRKEIDTYEEQLRLEEQQKQVQADINKHAWEVFKEGMALKKAGKYHSAISTLQKVADIGASDPKLLPLSKKMIAACYATIRALRDPVLKEAKLAEDASEFPKAFQLYKKATRIDPPHPAGYAGMNRIRSVLHEKAKSIYTEAILAESFSDFSTAKKLFTECMQVAPQDDIYHERAQRKLAHYFRKDEAPVQ